MFCPKCAQERSSVEVRYCSRCGFHLGGVDALLAQDAALAAAAAAPFAVGQAPRTRGMRLGAKLMFISMVLVPIFIGFSVLVDGPGPLVVPFTVFLAGLFRLIYALLFEERAPVAIPPVANSMLLPRHGGYAPPLPPPRSATLTSAGGRPFDTGEVVQPPSVTEHTTRFLEEK